MIPPPKQAVNVRPGERTGNSSQSFRAPHDHHMARDTARDERLEAYLPKFLDKVLRALTTDFLRLKALGRREAYFPSAYFPPEVDKL